MRVLIETEGTTIERRCGDETMSSLAGAISQCLASVVQREDRVRVVAAILTGLHENGALPVEYDATVRPVESKEWEFRVAAEQVLEAWLKLPSFSRLHQSV